MKTVASNSTSHVDLEYDEWMRRISERVAAIHPSEPLFRVRLKENALFESYLEGFTGDDRQYHNCHACRHFLERFGHLVTVDEMGVTHSALFNRDEAPARYHDSVHNMIVLLNGRPVEDVFYARSSILGTPLAGGWAHLHVKLTLSSGRVWTNRAKTAFEGEAEKLQDLQQVQRALSDFPEELLTQVVDLLNVDGDALYRSEKVLGQAKFLLDCHLAANKLRGAQKRNALFRMVAKAPAGFCHPRSSMIGTLLEDLASGSPFDAAADRFRKKMHPLIYQRPQAAPSEGQLDAAEKLVEKMGIQDSLKRRWAKYEDVQEFLWKPKVTAPAKSGEGVFDHLRGSTKNSPISSNRASSISWRKFHETVLPNAVKVELSVPTRGSFYGLLTAEVMDAPPILQWDRLERRNPVSWYLYHGGSSASRWNLSHGWTEIAGIAQPPFNWNNAVSTHFGKQIMFILPGAHDETNAGNALFPETLKSELHAVRAVIERYSKSAKISGGPGTANGYLFSAEAPVTVGVETSSGVEVDVHVGSVGLMKPLRPFIVKAAEAAIAAANETPVSTSTIEIIVDTTMKMVFARTDLRSRDFTGLQVLAQIFGGGAVVMLLLPPLGKVLGLLNVFYTAYWKFWGY